MQLTFTLTTNSVESYLQVLAVLDRAIESGEVDLEFGLKPDLESLGAIAEHALNKARLDKR